MREELTARLEAQQKQYREQKKNIDQI